MKHQNFASSVSRSFLLISRQSLVSVAGCHTSVWSAGARFSGRIRSAGGRFCPKRLCRLTLPLPSSHALPLHPSIGNMRLVGWTQLYHRSVPQPQETNNEILPALSLPITNCLNSILSLLHILNAMAITISRLYSS